MSKEESYQMDHYWTCRSCEDPDNLTRHTVQDQMVRVVQGCETCGEPHTIWDYACSKCDGGWCDCLRGEHEEHPEGFPKTCLDCEAEQETKSWGKIEWDKVDEFGTEEEAAAMYNDARPKEEKCRWVKPVKLEGPWPRFPREKLQCKGENISSENAPIADCFIPKASDQYLEFERRVVQEYKDKIRALIQQTVLEWPFCPIHNTQVDLWIDVVPVLARPDSELFGEPKVHWFCPRCGGPYA